MIRTVSVLLTVAVLAAADVIVPTLHLVAVATFQCKFDANR